MKTLKKVLCCVLAFAMFLSPGVTAGCGESLTISDTTATMELFGKKQLTVTTDIEGEVEWSNSNSTVVNMTTDGKKAELLAIKSGSATITAKIGGKSATCAVTVSPTEDTLTLALSSQTAVTLRAEETSQITSAVTFKGNAFTAAATSYTLANVSPAGCVTVSDSGLITAVAEGTAQVKVKAEYFENVSNEITVSVTALRKAKPAESVDVSADKAIVDLSQVVNLSALITPNDSTDEVVYSVTKGGEETTDATITDGKFTASAAGTYVVTATAGEKSDTVTITVPELELNKTDVKLVVNGDDNYHSEAAITATFTVDGSDTAATITAEESKDTAVATVDGGVITAVAEGETTVEFTFEYQSVSFKRTVTVGVATNAPAVEVSIAANGAAPGSETITLSNKEFRGDVDYFVYYKDFVQLAFSVTVDGAAVENPTVAWEVTTGSDLVTVENGYVARIADAGNGVAVVTATFTDAFGVEHSAEMTVNVQDAVVYGQHQMFAHEGIVAKVPFLSHLTMEDVPLTSDKNSPLIRFQKIPEIAATSVDDASTKGMTTSDRECRAIQVIIRDSANPNNYIVVLAMHGNGALTSGGAAIDAGELTTSRFGVKSCNMPKFAIGNNVEATMYLGRRLSSETNPDGVEVGEGYDVNVNLGFGGGYAQERRFSFYGAYLNETDYQKNMLGISVIGTKVYLINDGYTSLLWDLNDDIIKQAQRTQYSWGITESMVWGGFESSTVDIEIRIDLCSDADQTTTLLIDKLGGENVTAQTAEAMKYNRVFPNEVY